MGDGGAGFVEGVAVDRERAFGLGERDARVTGGGDDAAPVGIVAGDGGFDERPLGDAFAIRCGRLRRDWSQPATSMVTKCSAPSASRMICCARSVQTSSSAGWRRSRSVEVSRGSTPRARRALASSRTVSLVLVWPSTLMQLKLASTAVFSSGGAASGERAASVRMTASMVAMLGAIMAAPLQTPVIVHRLAVDVEGLPDGEFVDGVGGHDAACGGGEVRRVCVPRPPTAGGIPAASLSRGRKRPMTSGRADEDVGRDRSRDARRRRPSSRSASSRPRCPGAGVGVAGIDRRPRGRSLLGHARTGDPHRCSDDAVLREHPSGRAGPVGDEQRQVEFGGVGLDSARMAGGAEALREGVCVHRESRAKVLTWRVSTVGMRTAVSSKG